MGAHHGHLSDLEAPLKSWSEVAHDEKPRPTDGSCGGEPSDQPQDAPTSSHHLRPLRVYGLLSRVQGTGAFPLIAAVRDSLRGLRVKRVLHPASPLFLIFASADSSIRSVSSS